jgi:hypothetical protein
MYFTREAQVAPEEVATTQNGSAPSIAVDQSAEYMPGGLQGALDNASGNNDSNARKLLRSPALSARPNTGIRVIALSRAQHTHGNRYTQRLVSQIQLSSKGSRTIQRECACGGTCEKCSSPRPESVAPVITEEPSLVQRHASESSPTNSGAGSSGSVAIPSDSFGQPLDESSRQLMERHMDADFSDVRVHTDARAAASAEALDANAYTTGRDIYFGAGKYAPEIKEGQHLLAHELVHTVQQTLSGPVLSSALEVSLPNDPLEQEADRVADVFIADTAERGKPLAHELTHVNEQQQGAQSTNLIRHPNGPAERESDHLSRQARHGQTPARQPISPGPTQVQRDGPTTPPATVPAAINQDSVKESVDAIIKALSGITFGWDSARILAEFRKKDPATARAIIQGLKSRASEKGKGPDEMIDWMFEKMTAEDSRDLRHLFIALGVIDDVARIVAVQVKKQLEKWFTGGEEVLMALSEFTGPKLDAVLAKLEALMGRKPEDLAAKLFGDMDRVSAERLRQHFFTMGGPTSLSYAASWTATKIHSLLKGYVSHADSSQVLWNFQSTPAEYQVVVKQRLDPLTKASFGKSAGEALMEYLDKSDYEALTKLTGLDLLPWEDKRSGLRDAVGVVEWGAVFLTWTTCGVIGIATGLLSSIWDILVGIWDIGVAAWNLVWSYIYLVSGGAAGSDNWLAVKDFFRGMKALGSPGKLWDQYWEGLKLEFKTIEGPLTQCRVAELGVRKFINAVVNIVLIFVAGYGLVKIGVKAVQSIAELAALAREIGVLQALLQTGVKVGRAARKLISVTVPAELAKLANMLMHPVETLIKAGRQINLILLAVREEGVWAFMRSRTGTLLESEKKFWQEQKETWKLRAEKQQTRHAELSDDAVGFEKNLEEEKAPENPEATATELKNDAKKLEDDVDDLNKDLKDPERAPAPTHEAGMERATEEIRHAVCGFCFTAGTKVLTAAGYTNIEELKPGDLVLARDENGLGEPTFRRVRQTFQNITDSLLDVTIGTQLIRTTPGHVWWTVEKGWLLARDLAPGDHVLAANGELLSVTTTRALTKFALTYNLEVDGFQTYYVAGHAGAPGIWVHNQSVGVRVLRPDQVYQLILPQIVITDREAIRNIIRGSLEATGSYSTELRGLYSFLRQGGGAGFQGVTGDAITHLEVVLANVEQKGGGVVAAIDLERIGAQRVYELTNPEVMNRLMTAYPKGQGNMEAAWLEMASEGVVAVRGKIPARAVQSLVKIPPDLSGAEKQAILEELLKPCK